MQYRTKQREILMDFFNNNHDKVVSAEEIANSLITMGISLSAVYRNLAELESEGKIRKVTKSGTRKTYYQFMDCCECKDHLHIICSKCGRTDHLKDNKSSQIVQQVLHSVHFNSNKSNVVLYGLCEKCSR